MLSRVARNIYWTARYLERAENTARIVGVHGNLLMDMPRRLDNGWESLLTITGSSERFFEHYEHATEQRVVEFMFGDERNPGCIKLSLQYARENLRTTRDIVPQEIWEAINDLQLWTQEQLALGVTKRQRHGFLAHIIQAIQRVNGYLYSTMSRNIAYDFFELGRYLERGDMTSRILDVRAATLLPHQLRKPFADSDEEELNPFENIQWMSLLRSVSAYQMYRQQVRLRVQGADVLAFLLQNDVFPRACRFCLDEMERCLKRLPKDSPALIKLAQLQQELQMADVKALVQEGLHQFIDEFQIGLAELHNLIDRRYLSGQTEPTADDDEELSASPTAGHH